MTPPPNRKAAIVAISGNHARPPAHSDDIRTACQNRLRLSSADRLTDVRFGSKGKPVKQADGNREHVDQDSIGRQDQITGAGTLPGKPGERENQAQGADQDVDIDVHHAPNGVGLADAMPVPDTATRTYLPPDQYRCSRCSGEFGNERAERNAICPHAHDQNEERIKHDVGSVQQQNKDKDCSRPADPDEKPVETHSWPTPPARSRSGYRNKAEHCARPQAIRR